MAPCDGGKRHVTGGFKAVPVQVSLAASLTVLERRSPEAYPPAKTCNNTDGPTSKLVWGDRACPSEEGSLLASLRPRERDQSRNSGGWMNCGSLWIKNVNCSLEHIQKL